MNTVVIKKCDRYDVGLIKSQINLSLQELGGLDLYIKPKSKVLLKTNLMTVKKPIQAATTHPTFVEALIEIFKEHECEVIIADSPGGPYISSMMKRVYKATKMEEISDKHGIELNRDYGSYEVFDNKSSLYKKMKICNFVKNADHIISVSKLKTHAFITFTGAVKNMFGVVPGLAKADLHMQYPELLDFGNMLVDVCTHISPTLSFMDGIIAMEGEGPGSGNPRQMNTILTSTSPYHLDVVASKMINIDPKTIPTVYNSIERGIVKSDFSDIDLIGNMDEFIEHDFVQAQSNKFKDGHKWSIWRYFKRFPKIITKSCVGCKDCANVCPANTIDIVNKKAVINYENCISCFCCHEFCPVKAITVKRKLFRKNLK
ncbi:DUF362 domain-containing protein [Mycoplasmatota bacterium]|nr:DUF362 domain-containing protein [Mycoplasmatota bacterium]